MDAIYYIALFFSLVIGLIFGGLAAFFSRRFMFNRQLRIAERKAAKMVAEARNESKDILQVAQEEAKRLKSAADSDYRERRSEIQKQENSRSSKG